MKCPKCGRERPDNVNFCEVCGSAVGITYVQSLDSIQKPQRDKKRTNPVLFVAIFLLITFGLIAGLGAVFAFIFWNESLFLCGLSGLVMLVVGVFLSLMKM